jgi:adenine-specific DNA-methyltransferase
LERPLTEAFLKRHPTLVVNTANFDEDFKQRLLQSFGDLHDVTDGLFVRSENYQALRFLERSLFEQVDFTYIDPPYNTGEDEFVYKDNYQHASWLALMYARLEACRGLMRRTGTLAASIDDTEFARLVELYSELFPGDTLATLVWDRNRKNDAKFFSVGHEYMLVAARDKQSLEAAGIRFREPKEGLQWASKIIARLSKQYGNHSTRLLGSGLKHLRTFGSRTHGDA